MSVQFERPDRAREHTNSDGAKLGVSLAVGAVRHEAGYTRRRFREVLRGRVYGDRLHIPEGLRSGGKRKEAKLRFAAKGGWLPD